MSNIEDELKKFHEDINQRSDHFADLFQSTHALDFLKDINISEENQYEVGELLKSINSAVDQLEFYQRELLDKNKKINELWSMHQSFLSNIQEGIAIIDNNGSIRDINNKCLEILGCSYGELIGKSMNEIMIGTENNLGEIIENISKHESTNIFNFNTHDKQRQSNFEISIKSITDTTDKELGMMIIFNDQPTTGNLPNVGEFQNFEDSEVGLIKDLDGLQSVRPREFNVERSITDSISLDDHNKFVYQIETESEHYMSILSHDLQNFNNTAMGFLELTLMSKELPQNVTEYLKKSLSSIENGSKLVAEIRKIFRIKYNKEELKKIDIYEIMDESIDEIRKNFHDKEIIINNNLDKNKFYINGDSLAKELFKNIFLDTVGCNPNETVELDLEIKPYIDNGSNTEYWQLMINNPNMEISEEHKELIFDAFSQERKLLRSNLFLPIVKSMVERYDGKIWLDENDKNSPSGSRFNIQIPKYYDNSKKRDC